MAVTLSSLMEEKVELFSAMESLNSLSSPCMSLNNLDDEGCRDLHVRLGELLVEHGEHMMEYAGDSATTGGWTECGELFVNWGKYIIGINRDKVKVIPFRPKITNPAKYVPFEWLGRRDGWERYYNIPSY